MITNNFYWSLFTLHLLKCKNKGKLSKMGQNKRNVIVAFVICFIIMMGSHISLDKDKLNVVGKFAVNLLVML